MKKVLAFAAFAAFMVACQSVVVEPVKPEQNPSEELLPMNISLDVATKVTDYEYEYDDKVGIYVVNQPNSLSAYDNHYTNLQLTYQYAWNPSQDMYWHDKTTYTDFYCYYPYSYYVDDVYAMHFIVAADQRDLSALKASDFAWGKSMGVYPTQDPVSIQTNHIMSSIKVYLEPGDGFTYESLESSNVNVSLRGVRNNAQINLQTGEVDATGECCEMHLYRESDFFRGIVVPQYVYEWEGFMVVVSVNGHLTDTDTPADVINACCGAREGTTIVRTVGKLIIKQRWLPVAAMSFLTAKSYVWHATN
jgi:hypothetical protein